MCGVNANIKPQFSYNKKHKCIYM